MKLRFVLATFAILTCTSLYAQKKPAAKPSAKAAKAAVNYKVSWGPDLKLKGSFPEDILLYNSSGYYATTGSSFNDYLSKFNNKMELVTQAKMETEKSDKNMKDHNMVDILEFNKNIYAISRERDKENKTIVYFAEKINLNTLIPDGNKTKIYEASYATEKKREDMWLGRYTDKDKKIMVLYEQHPAVKEENIKLTVHCIDENLKTTWKKEVELPLEADSKKGFSFDKYIDASGHLFLLAKVYNNDGKKKHKDIKDGQLNYDYHIYTIGQDIPTFVDYAFNLTDKAVSQINLDVNNKGEMVACGFYSDIKADKDKTTGSKGVFYASIDPIHQQVKAQSYKKFDNEVFTAGLSEKKKNKLEEKIEEGKREGDASSYIIRDLVPRKDGGSTMFAEEFYTYTESRYDSYSKSWTYITHYVYQNIIITKINSAGEIEWTSVIPKSADLTNYVNICSYLKFDEGDDTYDIFFNDHRDNLVAMNLEKRGVEAINGKLKTLRFVRVVVNPDGSLSKREQALKMDEDDEDTRFYPKVSAVVSENEIILYGVDHKRDKFAKITFNNL